MITKKQLQERVGLFHKQIHWILRAEPEQLKEEIENKYKGLSITHTTRDEMIECLLRGLASELFHPGL